MWGICVFGLLEEVVAHQFLTKQTVLKMLSTKQVCLSVCVTSGFKITFMCPQIQRLNELEDTVADQANMIAALTEKIRQKEEEVIAVRVKLQQRDRHITIEKDQ